MAVDGPVYDVFKVAVWKTGIHKNNQVGIDITDAIRKAPHGLSVINNLPVVGKYVKE